MSAGRAMPQDVALQREIDEARAELTETVHELVGKLDVRAHLKKKVHDLSATATQHRAALGGGAAGLLVVVLLVRRHNRG